MRCAGGERGLTLIETVAALALVSIIALTFVGLITTAAREWGSLQGQADVQQHPRVATGRIAAEVRQARDYAISASGTALGLVKVTVLAANAASGATSITVEDAAALRAGKPIVLLNLNRAEQVTATGIAGNTVTISPALAAAHRRGEGVRRAQSVLSAGASSGAGSVTVADGTLFATGDPVAVGNEGPFVVTVSGNTLTFTGGATLAETHDAGEVVQPLTVMFQCESGCPALGAVLTRCTQSCDPLPNPNRVPLADLLAAATPRPLFAATRSTLTAAATAGSKQLCLVSVSGFAVDDVVLVGRDTYASPFAVPADRLLVTGVDGGTNCLTVTYGILTARPARASVRVAAVELNVLATQFNDLVQQTQEVRVATKVAVRN